MNPSDLNRGGVSRERHLPEREANTEKEGDRIAAIYARTSSSSQRFGYSIEEQVRRCWEHCESFDWEVRFQFADEAESGRDTDRPQFQEMLEKAKKGWMDVIVFWKLDRFCRSLVDLVKTEEKLDEWDVALQSVTEYIDTMTAVGRFNFRNMASAAELESDLTGQRARMGMYGLAKEHRWPNDQAPLGYSKNEDGTLCVEQEEAELVERIFQMYIEERSMPQVAYLLNEEGVQTKRGDSWSRQAIKKVLSNELYIGEYQVAGFEDHVESYRILDDDLYEKVTETRYRFQHSQDTMNKDRKQTKGNRILSQYKNILEEDG
jgi:site-specific DNA recombinase